MIFEYQMLTNKSDESLMKAPSNHLYRTQVSGSEMSNLTTPRFDHTPNTPHYFLLIYEGISVVFSVLLFCSGLLIESKVKGEVNLDFKMPHKRFTLKESDCVDF